MKKFIYLILPLLFFSCTKAIVDEPLKEIKFGNEVTVKSVVTGTAMEDEFGTYAYVQPIDGVVDGGWLIENGKYDKDGNAISGPYYWPKSDSDAIKVDFFAFSPYKDASRSGTTITVPIDASNKDADCEDVLYSYKANVSPTEDRVSLSFEHELAWVQFRGKYTGALSNVKINHIIFGTDLKTSGSLIIDTTNGSASTSVDDSTTHFDLGNSTVDLGTSYKELSNILVIPQVIPTSVTINYAAKIGGITYSNKTATVALSGTFEKGKQYIYNIDISVWEVLFAASVSSWTPDETVIY